MLPGVACASSADAAAAGAGAEVEVGVDRAKRPAPPPRSALLTDPPPLVLDCDGDVDWRFQGRFWQVCARCLPMQAAHDVSRLSSISRDGVGRRPSAETVAAFFYGGSGSCNAPEQQHGQDVQLTRESMSYGIRTRENPRMRTSNSLKERWTGWALLPSSLAWRPKLKSAQNCSSEGAVAGNIRHP